MNRSIRPRLAVALLAALCALPALAAEPPADASAPRAEASQADARVVEADDAKTVRKASDRHCLRDTGTRIAQRGRRGECAIAAGSVYTRDDIERTGATDLADALRKLDTRIR